MGVPPGFLEILACPRCRGPLVALPDGTGLGCVRCALCYPVRDDFPVMIPEEAAPWSPS